MGPGPIIGVQMTGWDLIKEGLYQEWPILVLFVVIATVVALLVYLMD